MLRTFVYCAIGALFGAIVALMLQVRPEMMRDLIKGGALAGFFAGVTEMSRRPPARRS